MALSVLCLVEPAEAQESRSEPSAIVAQAGEKSFNIVAQPLSTALTAFGQQSGLQVSVDTAILAGLQSPGVSGTLVPEEALRRLLAGTGITWRFSEAHTVVLEKLAAVEPGAITLSPVQVEGRIPGESAFSQSESYRAQYATVGSKTDARIREVPSSVQVVTQQVLEDEHQLSVTDALAENVSGVTRDTFPRINGDNLRIRGFVANANYLRNGVPDNQIGRKTGGTLADVERVEVLKGPASVLYGLGAPGGTVNILTKQPLYEPLYQAGGTLGNHEFRRFDVDLSQPLTGDGAVAGRVNFAVEDSESFVDFEERTLLSVTPVLRFDIGETSRLTLEASYSMRDQTAARAGLPVIGTVVAGPDGQYIPRRRNLNEPFNSDDDSDTFRAGFRFETELAYGLTFRSQGDYARFRDSFSGYGMVAGGEAFGFGLQADGRTYGRGLFEPRGGDDTVDGTDIYYTDNNLVAEFATAGISHKTVAGMTYSYEDALNNNFQISGPFFIDVYDPVYTGPTAAPIVELTNTSKTEQFGFYLQDQIGFFDDRLKLVLGGRYDLVEIKGTDELVIFGAGAPTRTSLSDGHFSGRAGIVYDLTEDISLYGSYAQSYVPQAVIDETGNVIEPETGEQFEFGIKADWLNDRLSTTAAVFDLTRDNVARFVGLNVSASGKQRSRGLELDVAGEFLPGWKVIGSFTHMDTEVLRDSNPAEEGLSIANTPDNKFTLFSSYTLQSGPLKNVMLGAGVLFFDDRRVQNSNTPVYELPSFWRVDLMAGYRWGPVDLQVNLINLLDERYFIASQDINEIYDGDPRTVLFTGRIRF